MTKVDFLSLSCVCRGRRQHGGHQTLFDLAFLVDHVLPDHGIKFLDLHFFRHVFLVFGGRVEVAGSSTRDELDLVTHGLDSLGSEEGSDFLAARAKVFEDCVNATLVNGPKALRGDAKTDPSILAFHPKTVLMEIRIKYPLGFVVSVGHVVAYNTALARYLAYSGHLNLGIALWITKSRSL